MIQKKKWKKIDSDVVEYNVLNPLFADYFFPAVPVLRPPIRHVNNCWFAQWYKSDPWVWRPGWPFANNILFVLVMLTWIQSPSCHPTSLTNSKSKNWVCQVSLVCLRLTSKLNKKVISLNLIWIDTICCLWMADDSNNSPCYCHIFEMEKKKNLNVLCTGFG